MEMAVKNGKATRPELHCGICGEHGGDPSSVEFCHKIGLDYVSCSPFRVPIARLAAAQAAIAENNAKKEAATVSKEELEARLAAAKETLAKLQDAAADATDDIKEVVAKGLKSIKAGWEEAKKTFDAE